MNNETNYEDFIKYIDEIVGCCRWKKKQILITLYSHEKCFMCVSCVNDLY